MTKTQKKNDKFNINTFNIKKFKEIIKRGLSSGEGQIDGQMCIEAAICETMGENNYTKEDFKNGDLPDPKYRPKCVTDQIIDFKVSLNDREWSNEEARAEGLFDLGLVQLGSRGVIKGSIFIKTFKQDYSEVYTKSALKKIKEQLTINQIEIFDFLYNKYEKKFDIFREKIQDLSWDDIDEDIMERISNIENFNGSVEDILNEYEEYNDDDLNLIATVALNVLIKLKSPGVKLLKNKNLRKV